MLLVVNSMLRVSPVFAYEELVLLLVIERIGALSFMIWTPSSESDATSA